MRSRRIALLLLGVAVGCAKAPPKLDPQRFEAAKQACHAPSAFQLRESAAGVSFRGPPADYAVEARCLMDKLAGTDIRFVGYISEPPPGDDRSEP